MLAITACLVAALGAASCPLPDPSAGTALAYDSMRGFVVAGGDDAFTTFAPIVLVENYAETYNRVGMPAARLQENGDEEIYVDPATPTFYVEKIEWASGTHRYTNLVYRVHFEMGKANKYSRDGGRGDNVGLLMIVTLDESGKPIWLNTVGSCGCFHAIVPTTFLPKSAYPASWNTETLNVYGEHLSGLLTFPEDFDAGVRPVVFLRDGSHRVAEVQVASIDSVREHYPLTEAHTAPMESLKHLPLGEGETSFYYEDGDLKGLVKGAYKRGEALALGAWIGDGRVGQDRVYGSEEEVPRGFYTSINPADKDESDMWDYKSFLEQNGWKP